MNGATVSLIINLLLIFVLIIGFVIGVVRGAKKQGVRSIYFVGFLIVFLLFAPLISSALMGLQINGQSLSGLIESALTSNQGISNLMTSNPALHEFITKLPIVVINLAVSFALVLLALLFSGIGYLITKHVHLNKYKREEKKLKKEQTTPNEKIYTVKDGKPVIVDKVEPKSKRYRWWGGLIGAVSGFVIMFALLLPITGLARTAMTYIDFSAKAAEVVAEEKSDDFAYQELSDKLKEILGPDVVDILSGVNNSVFIKVTSVGDIDLALFDTISSVKVNGHRITLRNEINAVANVAESILYVMDAIPVNQNGDFDFSQMDWKTIAFDKLENAINSLFSSDIIRSMGSDLINNVFTDDFVDQNITKDLFGEITDEEFEQNKNYVKEVFKEIRIAYQEAEESNTIDQIKNDLLSVLGVAKAVVNSGLANYLTDIKGYHDNLTTPQTTFDVVVECLRGNNPNRKNLEENNYDFLKDITDSIFKSTTIKGLLVAGVNIASDALENEIKNMVAEQETQPTEEIKIRDVTQENINWDNVSNSFKNLINGAIDIYKIYQDEMETIVNNNELNEQQKIEQIVQSSQFETLAVNIGKILNNIMQSPLFEVATGDPSNPTQSLLDEVLNQLNKVDKFNQYADLSGLINLNWEVECTSLANALQVLNEIVVDNNTVLSVILNQDSDTINATFEKLSQEQIKTILSSLDSSKILSKLTSEFLNKLNIELIKVIDDTYNKNVVDKNINLVPQEETISKVLYTGLKIKNLDFNNSEIVLQNEDAIKAFIDALEENATLDPAGIFKDAYDKYSAKFEELFEE